MSRPNFPLHLTTYHLTTPMTNSDAEVVCRQVSLVTTYLPSPWMELSAATALLLRTRSTTLLLHPRALPYCCGPTYMALNHWAAVSKLADHHLLQCDSHLKVYSDLLHPSGRYPSALTEMLFYSSCSGNIPAGFPEPWHHYSDAVQRSMGNVCRIESPTESFLHT